MDLNENPAPHSGRSGQTPIVLVSCVSKKRDRPAPAEDLYCSSWFIKAKDYARSLSNRWFILSAKHGLIGPQTIIEPYNQTLRTVGPAERRHWASMVAAALSIELNPGDRVVILAGATYRKYLVPMIEELGVKVEIPLEGKGIGEQLAWLKRHTA